MRYLIAVSFFAVASAFAQVPGDDLQNAQRKAGNTYGVNAIPHAFLIDPDGVIVWAGHPARLKESALDAALAARESLTAAQARATAANAAFRIASRKRDFTVPKGISSWAAISLCGLSAKKESSTT